MGVSSGRGGDAGDDVGDLKIRRSRSTHARLPFLASLALCAAAYVGFHLVRARLPEGAFRNSFPSLLAPIAMFSIVELTPGVRFRSRRMKLAIESATLAIAVLWLEAIVPRFTTRATGSLGDAIAMGIGFALFCAYDVAIGRIFDA